MRIPMASHHRSALLCGKRFAYARLDASDMTPAQFRKLALAMPQSEEKSHFGQPDFRVRGKIFAGLDPDGTRGTLKLSPELQAMLLDARPHAFSPAAGYWG